ncbi:RNA helicase [Streptococcus sp. A27]|uniref:RNA helicase n=1 Tax=unclassified Streptococcus TaxID=2608887 RepID=UPI00374D0A67
MKKVKIMLDFLAGPIWKDKLDEETFESITGIYCIDNDKILQDINTEIQNMYSSYYHFNDNMQSFWFDEEQEKKDKEKILQLLNKLKMRLSDINDGTYFVEDYETERISNL